MNHLLLLSQTGKALRKLRHSRELSQKQVAAGIPMEYSCYNRLENGLNSLHLSMAFQIAAFYKMKGSELVALIENTKV